MWRVFIINALVFCSFSRAIAAEKEGSVSMSYEIIMASVRANDIGAFEKAANNVYVERQRLCRELIGVLQDAKSSNLQKCSAAYYLGEMRMSDAVAALADHITLRSDASGSLIKRLPVMKEYPAVEALIRIGKPSTRQMIQNLEERSDSLVRELCARVIRDVEGYDFARIIIQAAIAKQSDTGKKERLQAALLLKNLADVQ